MIPPAALVGLLGAVGAWGLLGAVGAWRWIRNARRVRRGWLAAAAAAGLEDVVIERSPAVGATFAGPLLTGRKGGQEVHIARGPGGRTVRVVVDCHSDVTLRAEAEVSSDEREGTREIQLGDADFDAAVYARGDEALLRAALDADTRRLVRELVAGFVLRDGRVHSSVRASVAVRDGRLIVETGVGHAALLRAKLSDLLASVLPLAARLGPTPLVLERLAQGVRRERDASVRRGTIRYLAEYHPRSPVAREVLQRACRDESQDVQLEAALGLRLEGHAVLREIAGRDSVPDVVAARALEGLGRDLSAAEAVRFLERALRARHSRAALTCVAALQGARGSAVVAPLVRVLAEEGEELAVAAAGVLGATGDPGAELVLLKALARQEVPVQVAAAEALGQAGSATAVLTLQEVAAHAGGALRKAAREAVVGIQSRLQGASPGQLSLAGEGDPAGRVSLAETDPRGRVSVPDAKDGGGSTSST
jgi:HEAT repeat protein